MSIKNITNLTRIIGDTLFTIDPPLNYDRLLDALFVFCDLIEAYEGEGEDIWFIEAGMCSPGDILAGVYFHLVEWHGGQSHKTYACLCAIMSLYNPGMADSPEPESSENDIYNYLDGMAKEWNSLL